MNLEKLAAIVVIGTLLCFLVVAAIGFFLTAPLWAAIWGSVFCVCLGIVIAADLSDD